MLSSRNVGYSILLFLVFQFLISCKTVISVTKTLTASDQKIIEKTRLEIDTILSHSEVINWTGCNPEVSCFSEYVKDLETGISECFHFIPQSEEMVLTSKTYKLSSNYEIHEIILSEI